MVHVEGLDKLLAEHPFFEGMDDATRAFVAGCAANESFEAGQYIFREGGAADKFYLIRHGDVAVEIHVPARTPVVLETIHEGDLLGWSWLVEPYKWTFDARAATLVRALSLDGACLRKKMEADCGLGYEMYRRFVPVMAERLAASRLQLVDMYGNPGDNG